MSVMGEAATGSAKEMSRASRQRRRRCVCVVVRIPEERPEGLLLSSETIIIDARTGAGRRAREYMALRSTRRPAA